MEKLTHRPSTLSSPYSLAAGSSTLSSPKEGQWLKILYHAFPYLQGAADFLSIVGAFLGSYFFYTHGLEKGFPQTFYQYLAMTLGISAIYLLVFERVGLYKSEASVLNIKELRGIFRGSAYAAAVVLGLMFYIRFTSFSRITFTTALLLAPVVVFFQREFFYRLRMAFHRNGCAQKKILIFGAGTIGKHLAKRIFESPSLGLLPLGILDDKEELKGKRFTWLGSGPKQGLPILGGEEALEQAAAQGVEMVMICLPSATFERSKALVEKCIQLGLEYALVPNVHEKIIYNVDVIEIGGIPILRRRRHRPGFFYLAAKRLVDFALSFLLIAVLSPLLALFAIAIKVDSKGPLIFKQKRVGYKGREFSFYKFRTMHVEAPKYARSPANPLDPRITRVGRFLRRTSLDELPQLFNVLRGDMSIVGPRPEMPFIVADYTPFERRRLEAMPGITGVWQISAARGEPIHHNMEYDLFYLENRSLLLDLAIIVKTAISVIRGVGAV